MRRDAERLIHRPVTFYSILYATSPYLDMAGSFCGLRAFERPCERTARRRCTVLRKPQNRPRAKRYTPTSSSLASISFLSLHTHEPRPEPLHAQLQPQQG
jgi:hypothetical protein